jgi:hypothetical protein
VAEECPLISGGEEVKEAGGLAWRPCVPARGCGAALGRTKEEGVWPAVGPDRGKGIQGQGNGAPTCGPRDTVPAF